MTAPTAVPAWQFNVLAAAAQHLVDMRGSSREPLARRDLESLTAMFTSHKRCDSTGQEQAMGFYARELDDDRYDYDRITPTFATIDEVRAELDSYSDGSASYSPIGGYCADIVKEAGGGDVLVATHRWGAKR